jgi:hypothetical protein
MINRHAFAILSLAVVISHAWLYPKSVLGQTPLAAHVNFQPEGTPYPGYLIDSGTYYGVRANGYTYGWNTATDNRVRNSSLSPDQRYDTFVNMGDAVWEIAVPNDTYRVHVVVGDPAWHDVRSKLTVEGLLAIDATTSSASPWLEATVTVTVTDGRLSVGNQPGSYNKICYIDIIGTAPTSGDTTAPAISGTSASSITSSAATITWTTDEPADSAVEYGTTAAYGSSTSIDTAKVVSHSRTLTGLAPNTSYHFRVKSRDGAGNLSISGDFTFATAAASGTSGLSTHINFQSGGTPAYPGYLVDNGLTYGLRGNGYSYGWSILSDSRTRNSSISPDARYDTFVVMGNAVWEIAVPNDSYTVHVVVGDPAWTDVNSKLTIEGLLAINGQTSPSTPWLEATVTVSVTDGRLTIGNLAGSYNKICYIDISAGGVAGGGGGGTSPDTTAPVSSSVTAANITPSSATITWNTNEPADSQVQYGPTQAYGSATALNSSLVVSHSQSLSNLQSGTTYNYRVLSRDAAGNLATSNNFTFTTTSASGSSTYSTNFDGEENPLSEGGAWHNDGIDWTYVEKTGGNAQGTLPSTEHGYNDSYALLSGFPPNHTASAVIHLNPQIDTSCTHEVELLLRFTDGPHFAKGYEVLLTFWGGIQMVRWNGAIGDFTVLNTTGPGSYPIKDGDILKASISGNLIRVYVNNTEIAQATDNTFTTGSPGISFFRRSCGANSDFAFKSFTATAQ